MGWIVPGAALLFALSPTALRADDVIDWGRPPIIPTDLGSDSDAGAVARPHRIRLFGIAPGFLSDPVGLSDADDPLFGAANDSGNATAGDSGPDWLSLTVGGDNPFFDLRRPGDPGGVGYYRVHSQVQLFESANTGCAVALQAVTPAGSENDGLNDGPTVLSPAFSVYHALDDGTAIQGFVGQHVNLSPRWTNQVGQSIHYGMAVQHPLMESGPEGVGNVYVFVEALGRFRTDGSDNGANALNSWDVLPGVHWQMAPNWWMSGGLVVPMTSATRTESNQWQITCSFQF